MDTVYVQYETLYLMLVLIWLHKNILSCLSRVQSNSTIHVSLVSIVLQTKVVRVDWLGNLANYKEDYSVSFFHVAYTVTVRILCSRCAALLVYWLFAHLHLKAFCYLCTVNVIYFKRKRRTITYNKENHQVS